jgi:ABC-type antimicrobial peptide transport system permease subunit
VAYSVSRRRGEIGIRAALGASPGSLVRLVLRDVLVLTALGLALGSAASLASGRFISTLLYGLAPGDPQTLAATALLLALVAVVAGYLPARRAAFIDPMECLRAE